MNLEDRKRLRQSQAAHARAVKAAREKAEREDLERRLKEARDKPAAAPPTHSAYHRSNVIQDDRGWDCEPRYCFPLRGLPGPDGNAITDLAHLNPLLLELTCFRLAWPTEAGGLGAFGHFKNAARELWPWLEWNPWLEDQIRSLCNEDYLIRRSKTHTERYVNWTGAGSAGKTFAAGLYAVLWWFSAPYRSSASMVTTSLQIMGQRVWPVIQKLVDEARNAQGLKYHLGHLVNHRKMLQSQKGDEKHSICGLAVQKGELDKALNAIKGRHTERMLLIVDESNTCPNAIFECIPNMQTSARELVILDIGNAGSQLDNHGRCCEPKDGWPSITIEDSHWRTRGVPEWGIGEGICCHYDGEKSPNVKAGRTIYPYIYSYEKWVAISEAKKQSFQYWQQDRGFWAPEGVCSTVFSAPMIDQYDGKGTHVFQTFRHKLGFLDTAFGGDQAILQFAELGDLADGRLAVQLTHYKEIVPSVRSKHELDYQIAHDFIKLCKEEGVLPQYAGLDATGTGRGVAAIVMHEWSDLVHYVEWGGAASDKRASEDDNRPSREVYYNRVAELWYSLQEMLKGGQLKGLYHEAIIELTMRQYEYVAKKIKLETKEELRERLRRSPDHGDAISGIGEVARRHGLMPGGGLRPAQDPAPSFGSLEEPRESVFSEDEEGMASLTLY